VYPTTVKHFDFRSTGFFFFEVVMFLGRLIDPVVYGAALRTPFFCTFVVRAAVVDVFVS
jgi:hypothetical protein